MVSRVVVVRELVAAVFFLLVLALFRPDPTPLSPDNLSIVNDTSNLSNAALLVVNSLLDDPVRFHALVTEMEIYDTRAAYYNDEDFDFPTIPSLVMVIDPTVVVDVPLAHATVFVPPRHRPSTRFMDGVLAAQVGPPTSTSPFDLPASVVTAPPPSSRPRPRPFPLLSPAINLDTLFVALALVAVSLLAAIAHLKLSRKPKASSPSPLPAIPSATKPAVSVPSARQAIENLVRQQNAQHQKNCLPHTTLVSIVPATQRLAVPAPVIPAAPPSPQTNTDVIYETNGGVIYETPRCRPSATAKTPAVPHRPSTPRSRASLAADSIIYQTAPHSSLSSNAPALSTRPLPSEMPALRSRADLASNAIIYQTRPSPLSSNAPPQTQTPFNPLVIYQTSPPIPSTSSGAPSIPHHPRPSLDVIYSTSNSTGSWASSQSRAPAPSPSVRYPTHNIGTIPPRQYEVFAARLPRASTSNGRSFIAPYPTPPHGYPPFGPRIYQDLPGQREQHHTLRVGEAHGKDRR
ncbi:hypothetical protein C8R46DRAFT_1187887 [Mycena filopes]|nr:hypothetical protein C8R46DRAFT_1187887 [Mycena filopes]